MKLRITMEDFSGDWRVANYTTFKIKDKVSNFLYDI